jgi:hypothetical protein
MFSVGKAIGKQAGLLTYCWRGYTMYKVCGEESGKLANAFAFSLWSSHPTCKNLSKYTLAKMKRHTDKGICYSKRLETIPRPSVGNWFNKLGQSHTTEHCAVITKRIRTRLYSALKWSLAYTAKWKGQRNRTVGIGCYGYSMLPFILRESIWIVCVCVCVCVCVTYLKKKSNTCL